MDRARVLVRRLTAGMALHAPKRLVLALEAPGLAHALLVALGGEPSTHAVAAVNQALIISADHELNASAFAARVGAAARGCGAVPACAPPIPPFDRAQTGWWARPPAAPMRGTLR